jgi:hypothetical protein
VHAGGRENAHGEYRLSPHDSGGVGFVAHRATSVLARAHRLV